MRPGKLRLGWLGVLSLTLLIWPSLRSEGSAPADSASLQRNNNLGVAYMEQLKFEEAAAQFAKNAKLDSSFVPAHVNLGIARFYNQDTDGAMSSFQEALRLDPNQIQARYMLGLIYRNQDQVEKAIGEFLEVNRKDPDDPSTNYFLGLLYSRQKEYQKAADYLRKAISRQPFNASARYNLAIALLRSGNREEGQREMDEFRKLQGQFGTDTVGLQYLEQGKHSFVIDRLGAYLPDAAPRTPSVRIAFKEVSGTAGLKFRHGGAAPATLQFDSRSALIEKIAPFVGSGLSFGDYDGDGLLDLYLANAGARGSRGALFRNKGGGRFEETTLKAGLEFAGATMTGIWGDYDNDSHLDLYLINCGPNVLYRNNGNGTFADVTKQAGVGDSAWSLSGLFVDFDHDGDLDIFVANFADLSKSTNGVFPEGLAGARNSLFRNDGNGAFTEVGDDSGLAGNGLKTLAAMATDFDNSRDIDFYLVNWGSPNQLLSNRRNGTFADVADSAGAGAAGLGGLAIGDFDNDGLMDFALPASDAARTSLLVNEGNQRFAARALGRELAGSAAKSFQNAQFMDFDNDGDLDLLLSGAPIFEGLRASGGRNLALFENRDGRFSDVSRQVGLDRYESVPVRGVSVADYDNDGDLDIAVNVNAASPLLLRNDGGNQNNWLQIELVGVNSNKPGIGSKVEILSGRLWQKQEIYGGHGFLSQNPAIAHFGLGRQKRADVVRLLWPGGVLQSEIDRASNQRVKIQELDRKGTSCPILYVWNGQSYEFVTDFLGGSAFGYLLAPGVYNTPDTDEYVKLDRRQVKLRDGKLALTMNNQLEEVIFFDRLQLVAVDHPAEYEVFPDEKLLPGPPYAEFRLFSVSGARPPVSAVDGRGADMLERITRIDRRYADAFSHLPFKGYADMHELTLDLGPISGERAVLLMHAWIDYADSTSNLAASQAGVQLTPPYVQVEDERGNWVTVLERMGFPAGLPKTMTVDLSDKFLSDSRKVKIVTNMRIYWDQILVESDPERTDYRIRRLDPTSADLHFRGFPRFYSPDGRLPKVYDYSSISPTAQWKTHIGGYTRYGEVRPLLTDADDMYVVTRAGDEIEAEFDVAQLPPLQPGWVRDYLVYVDGFGKDMDVNSAAPDFVGPLPFHGMRSYPYTEGEGYPMDEAHVNYLRQWNTRTVDGWMPDLKPGKAEKAEAP